jgi:dienelactone hydrolase
MDRRYRTASWIRLTSLAAVALVGVTACGGSGGKGQSAPSRPTVHPTAGAECSSTWEDGKGKPVWFTDKAGAGIGGVEVGTGTTGVVMAHMAGSDSCDWLPYGAELAATGYRVLAFDFGGCGVSEDLPASEGLDADIVAAAAFLRSEGATTIVLMGASMGAAASIVAATEVTPAPAAVVSLSAPMSYESVNASAAAPNLSVPVVFAAASQDPGFAYSAQSLYAATPGAAKKIVITDGYEHGTALLSEAADGSDKVRAAIQDLLKAHAPVSG